MLKVYNEIALTNKSFNYNKIINYLNVKLTKI